MRSDWMIFPKSSVLTSSVKPDLEVSPIWEFQNGWIRGMNMKIAMASGSASSAITALTFAAPRKSRQLSRNTAVRR